eukprot:10809296-Alexandrium_andersonii.AAC.1
MRSRVPVLAWQRASGWSCCAAHASPRLQAAFPKSRGAFRGLPQAAAGLALARPDSGPCCSQRPVAAVEAGASQPLSPAALVRPRCRTIRRSRKSRAPTRSRSSSPWSAPARTPFT